MAAAPAAGGLIGLGGRLFKDWMDNRRDVARMNIAKEAARDEKSAEHIGKLIATDPKPIVVDVKRVRHWKWLGWRSRYETKKVLRSSTGLRNAFSSVVWMLGAATAWAIAVWAVDPSITITTIPAASGVEGKSPNFSLLWGLIETYRDNTKPVAITAGGAALALGTGVLTLATFVLGLNASPRTRSA